MDFNKTKKDAIHAEKIKDFNLIEKKKDLIEKKNGRNSGIKSLTMLERSNSKSKIQLKKSSSIVFPDKPLTMETSCILDESQCDPYLSIEKSSKEEVELAIKSNFNEIYFNTLKKAGNLEQMKLTLQENLKVEGIFGGKAYVEDDYSPEEREKFIKKDQNTLKKIGSIIFIGIVFEICFLVVIIISVTSDIFENRKVLIY